MMYREAPSNKGSLASSSLVGEESKPLAQLLGFW